MHCVTPEIIINVFYVIMELKYLNKGFDLT